MMCHSGFIPLRLQTVMQGGGDEVTMSNNPRAQVSVIVPVYGTEYLDATLRSICRQDYGALEIIVCDNSGDPRSARMVETLAGATTSLVRYVRQRKPLTMQETLSRAIRQARGKYVKFVNDGDELQPDAITRLVTAIEAAPDIAVAMAYRDLVDERGAVLAGHFGVVHPFSSSGVVERSSLLNFLARYENDVIGSLGNLLCRRRDLLALSPPLFQLGEIPFSHLLGPVLCVRLLFRGHLAVVARPLVRHYARGLARQGAIAGKTYAERSLLGNVVRRLEGYPQKESDFQQVLFAPLEHPGRFANYDLHQGYQLGRRRIEKGRDEADWLATRRPNDAQRRLIDDYLARHPQGRTMALVVIDLTADAEKRQATLDSLCAVLPTVAHITPEILTTDPELASRYPHYRVRCVDAMNWVATLNAAIAEMAAFDWLLLLRAGERLTASGLLAMSVNLAGGQERTAVYGDELYRNRQGALGASCRPDFNLDYVLSLPAVMCRHWLFARAALMELGGFDADFTQNPEFEYIVRLIERKGTVAIGHLPAFMTVAEHLHIADLDDDVRALRRYLQRRGYPQREVRSALPGHYRLDYRHAARPLVSIIIPTRDQLPVLVNCVTSLLEKTRYRNYELLIVDNGSETPEARGWLDGVALGDPNRIRVLRYPHPFNYAAMNNLAARAARGEYLLLLNNDTAVIQPEWLENMLNHAQRPEVGIVGAKLLYPDGRIQHGGVVLGLRGPAEHPFIGAAGDSAGYMQRLLVDQNYSAVTAACLMVRASLYQEVAGLDEDSFKIAYNDVDLCLKVRERGYLIVWTPTAQVIHEGNASQKRVDEAAAEARRLGFRDERDAMYRKWLPAIANDPAYNANFSLAGRGFEIKADVKLNYRPLSWRPLPVVLAHNDDFGGCGHYRVIKPHDAMKEAGIIDGHCFRHYLSLPLLTRYDPDVLVLQRPLSDDFFRWTDMVKDFNHSFRVFELDDYLMDDRLNRQPGPAGSIDAALRNSLRLVDRLVVSTPALAQALDGYHRDIRVVENRLPEQWWAKVRGMKRQGGKPRIGWGGGSSHRKDLALIADVVKALAGEVEWVFLGMCPAPLRPYIHEFHPGVPIDGYPEKLASLNLDLALAPLEDNRFNRCKSNLRLLEFGACGFPVICSDIEPYRCELPVTRVSNRSQDWVDAIRMHLAEPDATARMGDALRAAVHRDWMLSGDNLQLWRRAWLP